MKAVKKKTRMNVGISFKMRCFLQNIQLDAEVEMKGKHLDKLSTENAKLKAKNAQLEEENKNLEKGLREISSALKEQGI